EVPDALWACTVFGAGKPFADDQVDDMADEKEGMAAFDHWVKAFIAHVEKKGVVPGSKAAERSAQSTTNPGRPRGRKGLTTLLPAREHFERTARRARTRRQ